MKQTPAIKRLLSRLKELRRIHNLTQEEFAIVAGISYKYYQAIEAGRRASMRLPLLEIIANAYGIGTHELLAPELPKTTIKNRPPRKRRPYKRKA